MLDYLVQESPRPCQPKVSNLQQYYVEKSIRYIKTKYPQDISVEDVAQYCGLNRSYLGKLFRDATGMTTQEYLIRQLSEPAALLPCLPQGIRHPAA